MSNDHPYATNPRLEAAILEALDRCGLSPTLARSVAALVPRVHDDWRICCGSGCEPCVIPLGRAVDMVRAQLGQPAPAQSAAEDESAVHPLQSKPSSTKER